MSVWIRSFCLYWYSNSPSSFRDLLKPKRRTFAECRQLVMGLDVIRDDDDDEPEVVITME